VANELKVRDHDTGLGRHDYKHSEIDHEDLEYDKVYPCTNALDEVFFCKLAVRNIPIASTSIHSWFHPIAMVEAALKISVWHLVDMAQKENAAF